MHIIATLLFLFWLYIVTECFLCFDRMHKGDKFCRLIKYVTSAIVPSLGVGVYVMCPVKIFSVLWLVPDLAVALFFWPTTYARFNGGFKNRIGDK